MLRLSATLLALLLPPAVVTAVQWEPTNCPGPKTPGKCAITSPGSELGSTSTTGSGFAVSLFFQHEPPNMRPKPDQAGWFTCTSANTGAVLCKRAWLLAEEGAAGSCYFVVAEGDSVECEGEGGVTFIGANKAALSPDGTGPTATPTSIKECTGTYSGSGSCTFSPGKGRGKKKEVGGSWVNLGFDVLPAASTPTSTPALATSTQPPKDAVVSIKCTTPPKTPTTDPFLCSYAVNTSIGMFNETSMSTPHHSSSCAFILPEGDDVVTCSWYAGHLQVGGL